MVDSCSTRLDNSFILGFSCTCGLFKLLAVQGKFIFHPWLLCSLFHYWLMRYMNCSYRTLFCCYTMKLNDRILCRSTKLCILILPLNCLLIWFKLLISVGNMKSWQYCNALLLYVVKILSSFKFWWISSLFTAMSVFCYDSEKWFSWKFDIFTFFLMSTKFNMLFYYFFNFQNWLFIFWNYFKVWN